jgi:CRISPR system Cascade subunit CasC
MSPIIETHLIQSLQPNNLNRDDTGAPKSTIFGGVPRRRVSSQALKRAQREYIRERNLLDVGDLGVRTKRLVEEIANRLRAQDKPEELIPGVARAAVQALGFGVEATGKTKYLVFVSAAEIERAAAQAADHFDELARAASGMTSEEDTKEGKSNSGARKKEKLKDQMKQVVDKATLDAFASILGSGKAVDVALFGRMLADLPERNVEAASQVAHAISTHAVDEEWDYYTAIDDLKPDDTSGADMIGSIGYSACCLYRYQAVHSERLVENLDGNADLARRAIGALLEAIVHALPGGKQTTLASPNPPSTVLAVVRDYGGESLANAFLNPVRADDSGVGLEERSLERLADYWARLRRMYGDDGISAVTVASLYPERLEALAEHQTASVSELIERTVAQL